MGERKVWSVVRVPAQQIEDARQLHRELAALVEERTRIRNRNCGLLAVHGVSVRRWSKVREEVASLRLWDESVLGEGLRRRLEREIERMEIDERQIHGNEEEMEAELKEAAESGSDIDMMQC